jgi:hypothetical protein
MNHHTVSPPLEKEMCHEHAEGSSILDLCLNNVNPRSNVLHLGPHPSQLFPNFMQLYTVAASWFS